MDTYKYPVENVPFPGVAICNINKISKKNAMKLAMELYVTVINSIELVQSKHQFLFNYNKKAFIINSIIKVLQWCRGLNLHCSSLRSVV